MGQLTAIQFRVTNFRNVDDSGWIPVEQITAFVGRNESGKTALLKALHKFNPATAEPYSAQREFPRDRYTKEFQTGADWPVCAVAFALAGSVKDQVEVILGGAPPREAICTRFYDGSLKISYAPAIAPTTIDPAPVVEALNSFASAARRLAAPAPEQEAATQTLRTQLATWASVCIDRFTGLSNLHNDKGVQLLATTRKESEGQANPQTADIVEELQKTIDPILATARKPPVLDQVDEIIEMNLPVFIYFENYGILDSAIYLPRFLEDYARDPNDSGTRTVNAMFKHVKLTAQEIADLGREEAAPIRQAGQKPDSLVIAKDKQRKEERAIKLNSASIDISARFSDWWSQRRHKIRYHADGDYFRIWVADNKRPDVEIELEARSKGFQWFFSFYLVFLVESDDGHKDAVLLLDEPGLDLHPTAQQELIGFFEKLAEKNQLMYTTHSPFLIDGEHIHRVRPVTEDETGHSRISTEWPKDRETILPLQAAAGYAMVRGLFQHKQNVLVEGMSDYYYLHGLSLLCTSTGRTGMPDDMYVTPCGGAKLVGNLASLFLGQNVRPLILLDSDTAGRVRRDALMNELYVGHADQVVMLGEIFNVTTDFATDFELEDLLGEGLVLPEVSKLVRKTIKLERVDRAKGALLDQIKSAVERLGATLPDGWKVEVARRLVTEWATKPESVPAGVLDKASTLFTTLRERIRRQNLSK
jgi:energy-coupling factor transporter ATP-binding protein EcfA2